MLTFKAFFSQDEHTKINSTAIKVLTKTNWKTYENIPFTIGTKSIKYSGITKTDVKAFIQKLSSIIKQN